MSIGAAYFYLSISSAKFLLVIVRLPHAWSVLRRNTCAISPSEQHAALDQANRKRRGTDNVPSVVMVRLSKNLRGKEEGANRLKRALIGALEDLASR
jgi:hypothetical protein